MSETYLIEFRVKPGQLQRFHRLLGGVLDAMRLEETFHGSALVEDADDPCHLTLIETWEDRRDVLEVQLDRPYRQEWHAALPEILEVQRRISVWRPLRADGSLASEVKGTAGR